ncbi:alpha/beta fold hydrolase [Roseixanthobacter liquoris]|uniref:alpha/beta fold hydrolase n=1 Tax=Roseixanthobacter liquoris TaxID=3119921 RepID=UPI003726B890
MISPAEHKFILAVGPDAQLAYCADDFSDPWSTPDTVVMLHGIAEEAAIWRPWVPHLARRHCVVRPDLRGFGSSSPLPEGRAFAISDWADDIERLVAALGARRVHLVATKLGALVACELAQRQPSWLASLTLAGMLASARASLGPWVEEWVAEVERNGVEGWARMTMPGRMGPSLPPVALDWWIRLMAKAAPEAVIACLRLLPGLDGPPNPERIACPTLFLVSAGGDSARTGYDQRPAIADVRRLQERIANSELGFVEADSYHIAATHPDACAAATATFIAHVNSTADGRHRQPYVAASGMRRAAGDI